MSKELLDTLETKVFSAVDTIENLRAENSQLREDRRILEDKLQSLIGRMAGLDNGASEMPAAEPEPTDNSGNGTGSMEAETGGNISNFRNPYSEY